MIETKRLIIDKIDAKYAPSMFKLASNPSIGYWCGWKPHKDVNDSLYIINNVLNDKENYGIFLKENKELVGGISIKTGNKTDLTNKSDECEIGYWIGEPYQRKGYCLEAIEAILYRAFILLNMNKVYCAYYEGNFKSKALQEKAGFMFLHKSENVYISLLNEYRNGYVNVMDKENYLKKYQNLSKK